MSLIIQFILLVSAGVLTGLIVKAVPEESLQEFLRKGIATSGTIVARTVRWLGRIGWSEVFEGRRVLTTLAVVFVLALPTLLNSPFSLMDDRARERPFPWETELGTASGALKATTLGRSLVEACYQELCAGVPVTVKDGPPTE